MQRARKPSTPRRPVAVVLGTRPEAIKLAPVILALNASRRLRPVVVATSQHRTLVRPILENFGLRADVDLRVMRPDQSLPALSARLLTRLEGALDPSLAAVLVQGDTTSSLMGGLVAFYQSIPLGHVEAGLRTGDLRAPWPEELNRTLLARLARWHFAPTSHAVGHLRREGISPRAIHRTGNTVVDAVHLMRRHCRKDILHRLTRVTGQPVVLVTCHRRENQGAPLRSILAAIKDVARTRPDVCLLFPVHPNPAVRQLARSRLTGTPNIRLCRPLDYIEFLSCLKHADVVLSDSGGVQEEATVLGKRVLVMREQTERPEGLRAGTLTLVGRDRRRIEAAVLKALQRPARPFKRTRVFGDGMAARRIVSVLEKAL